MEIFKTAEFWYFLIPVIIGFVIYLLDKSVKEEKKHLLILFKSNQTISKNIQEKLRGFIVEFSASNAIAFPEKNVTYGTWLEMMSEEYKKNLSDELYEFTKKEKIPKPTLLSMTDSLNRQNEALRLIEIDMDLIIKKAKEGRV
ncbi:hypothetical protein V8245_09665 [Flavobacterium columnare]|uniref:hypothetical protein n=1 Tax=Flavobacterium columnare TaxID=996 RepID=UPI0007F9A70B|nr:hypothetical protein [Flavobacterium columnare]ANO48660.1 hypothetical protein Pf1_00412 [Flavobacterium columnare]APT23303.1 hypothetical protein BU993_12145 [Flavobacterium columnare]OOB83730.1 hypothetical protein BZL53_01190 [Flavobacterium columnare]